MTNELNQRPNIIVSVKPESTEYGLEEIIAHDRQARVIEWLDAGVATMRTSVEFQTLAEAMREEPPIFLQHICPVQRTVKMSHTTEEEALAALATEAENVLALLTPGQSFSVQTRFFGEQEKPYKKFQVNELLANAIEQSGGWKLNVTKPEQVVSVAITDEYAYIGVSAARDNISDWAGGRYRLAQESGQISRAEFKLLEALSIFDIDLPKAGLALDLGAAPGGWTRVLLNRNFHVHAVDPAKMHKSLATRPDVTHYKETAQTFVERSLDVQFDLIVNDMRIDTKESVSLMLDVYRMLIVGGVAIVTLKLPHHFSLNRVKQALARLSSKFRIVGAKQLFHNRSEITVVLRK